MAQEGIGGFAARRSDLYLAIAVIGILIVMIVPLPFFVLDLLITLSLSVSLVILMLVIYSVRPVEFTSFPSLLLIITVFRLALNVASTRLILLNGNNFDGRIIKAFGNFVVGGNYVVGAVIFLILVIIQFIVITKGSQRVAEVAARFTLDSMPGKQMAIDADLNAGIIDDKEALRRRKAIAREADFYGAMDGASKFVRGDAIAGIIIVVVNLVGGIIIGIIQQHIPPLQAVQTYGLLTIGDGLVAQIPALLISVASGIMVTRAGTEEGTGLGSQLGLQLFAQPKAIATTAAFLLLLGAIPGLPKLPFFLLAGLVGLAARGSSRAKAEEEAQAAVRAKAQEPQKKKGPESVEDLLQIDPMELEIGYSLIPLADSTQGGDLLDRIVSIRRQCASDMGIIVPPIRVRDNVKLEPGAYTVKLRGSEIARGSIMPGHFLAMDAGLVHEQIPGIKTTEPAFGLPALWIKAGLKMKAEAAGYTIVNDVSVITTHLMEVIRSHGYEIVGRQEVKNLLDNLKKTYPALVEEVVPGLLTVGQVQKVLQNLLREKIAIRDLVTILEVLGDYGGKIKDTDLLTEYVRQSLGRSICNQLLDAEGKLRVFTLDPHLEETIGTGVKRAGENSYVALEPAFVRKLIDTTAHEINRNTSVTQPVVLCSPQVRMHFKRLTERSLPHLAVMSFNEVEPGVPLESVGMIEVADAA